MAVAVVYESRTGNTKKVADAIISQLPDDTVVATVDECDSIEGFEFAFVGFPMHQFGPDDVAKGFLSDVCGGHCVAMFVTHASPEDAPPLKEWMNAFREAASGCELIGLFDCQGELAEPVKQALLDSDDPAMKAWAEADDSAGQPDEGRLEKAREWARTMMRIAGPH